MINVNVIRNEGVIIVEPEGRLEQSDFKRIATEIDAFSEDKGHLVGLIIHTKAFPGWADFGAFLKHMKFVKEHNKKFQRVAIVTDSKIGAIGPDIANHFLAAQIQHFEYDSLEEAKQWIKKAV